MATLTQLQAWLTEAEQALHDLQVGNRAVSIDYAGKGRTTFQEGEAHRLQAYIADLKAQIAAAGGDQTGKRGPLQVTF